MSLNEYSPDAQERFREWIPILLDKPWTEVMHRTADIIINHKVATIRLVGEKTYEELIQKKEREERKHQHT